jgi:tight adherence protein C
LPAAGHDARLRAAGHEAPLPAAGHDARLRATGHGKRGERLVTRAVALAALAGVIAAGAIVELASVRRTGRRGRRWDVLAGCARAVARRVGAGHGSAGGLAGRIDAAGSNAGAGEVMLAKLAAAPAAALAVLTLVPVAPGRLGIALVGAAPVAGFFAPDLWLRRRARARARAIEAEQADVLDLLRVAVGAGLGPWRALGEVGRRHPGVLARELGAAARRVALGVPAEAALARLERRCPAAGTPALTAALRRADRLGAPPARALAALAADARGRQARRAAEHAARAAPKIQLVVALLLVPSVLLMVAAALVPALTGASL